jgi:hypothetical protein
MAVVGGAVIGITSYRAYQRGKESWKAARSADAIIGRADPQVIEKLRQQDPADPQRAAFNLLAQKDPRWLAMQMHARLKWESRHLRLTDDEIVERSQLATNEVATLDAEHRTAILESSHTARFLRDVRGMSEEAIASIVDAVNDNRHDAFGARLIQDHLVGE